MLVKLQVMPVNIYGAISVYRFHIVRLILKNIKNIISFKINDQQIVSLCVPLLFNVCICHLN